MCNTARCLCSCLLHHAGQLGHSSFRAAFPVGSLIQALLAVLFSAPVCVWCCWLLTVVQFRIFNYPVNITQGSYFLATIELTFHSFELPVLQGSSQCCSSFFSFFFKYDCYTLFFFLKKTRMNNPFLQGLNQSEALQIQRCIFLYCFCFTCINILFKQLQPLTVKSEAEV